MDFSSWTWTGMERSLFTFHSGTNPVPFHDNKESSESSDTSFTVFMTVHGSSVTPTWTDWSDWEPKLWFQAENSQR